MRLVVDSNILVAELLRKRGRNLIASTKLDLYIAQKMRNEVEYELKKRMQFIVNQGRIGEYLAIQQVKSALKLLDAKVKLVNLELYNSFETEARKRLPRDPNDWEAVALSLALSVDIWTEDRDFLGCGCPTWTTETLLLQIEIE